MFQSFINKFLLKKDEGQGSYSLTFSVIAFIVINLKLIFSGIDIAHVVKMSEFGGTDYGVALAAISALHLGNKAVNKSVSDTKGDKDVN